MGWPADVWSLVGWSDPSAKRRSATPWSSTNGDDAQSCGVRRSDGTEGTEGRGRRNERTTGSGSRDGPLGAAHPDGPKQKLQRLPKLQQRQQHEQQQQQQHTHLTQREHRHSTVGGAKKEHFCLSKVTHITIAASELHIDLHTSGIIVSCFLLDVRISSVSDSAGPGISD